MIFDCDYYNTPIASGYQDTEGSLTSPVLNFEAIGSATLSTGSRTSVTAATPLLQCSWRWDTRWMA